MIKNVLITGGTRGIGLGIARELARMGCNLAINGRRPAEEVKPVLDELSETGNQVIYCRGDISSSKDRARIIAETVSAFSRLQVLINNAGVGPERRTDLLETSEESFDRVMGINLKGAFFLTQQVAHHMIENRTADSEFSHCIINITSVSASLASVNRAEYCLSKAGLSMMSRLFASRLGAFNIPVYEVRPGIIETDMTAEVLEMYRERIAGGLSIQSRIGHSQDVGKAVAALVEGKLAYSSGQVLLVDGGITVPRL